ncbi:MAG: hypothetical protein Fur0022_09280 [Anaerolineales bacterium]
MRLSSFSPFLRTLLKSLLWLLIPLLLWWALKDVPFRDIVDVLGHLTGWQILALAGANTLLMLALSARWWLILKAQGYPIPYLTLSAYRLAAFSVAYFTPGPHVGGEPWQVFLPQQRHGVPGTVALSSLGLDKLLDLLANFTFLVLGVVIVFNGGLIGRGQGTLIVIFSLILLSAPLGYLGWLWRGGTPLTGLVARLAARRPRVGWLGTAARVVRDAEGQVGTFGRRYPRTFFIAILFSGLVWVGLVTEFWLALRFLGVELTLPQVIMVITAARIANLFPTPGALGTLEAGQVLVMETLGVNPAVGVGLSLIIRARDIAFGGVGLLFAGIYSPRLNFLHLEGEQ